MKIGFDIKDNTNEQNELGEGYVESSETEDESDPFWDGVYTILNHTVEAIRNTVNLLTKNDEAASK